MKKYIKLIFGAVLTFLVLIMVFGITMHLSKSKIDRVLETSSYSYLPKEAKNYIKKVYELSGEIILTEKNKQTNVPYLNPKFVNYLSLDDSAKEKVSLIPEVYVLDYVFAGTEDLNEEELPSSYDLRNVDGKTFITPLKDQTPLGLCWAFSIMEQAESYLMVKNNESYNDSTEMFSIRQFDYATSTNGIKNYNNKHGNRLLGEGASFFKASEVMAYGLTFIDDKLFPYSGDKNEKEMFEILNYKNSKYEVDGTVLMPKIAFTQMSDPNYDYCIDEADSDECYDRVTKELHELYIKEVKSNIIKYGGAYFGTLSPDSDCSFKNEEDGFYVLKNQSSCYSELMGHAMHAIGWDDNYGYSYCVNGNKLESTIDGKCSEGTPIKGKGAFILRNSWGDYGTGYEYVYQTYDSINDSFFGTVDVGFITSLEDTTGKNWDNHYGVPEEINYDTYAVTKDVSQVFKRNINNYEKIEKIKFRTMAHNGKFYITIKNDNMTYNLGEFSTEFPGIYTVDISSENYHIDGTEFEISITSDDTYLVDNSISVFTSNVDSIPIIYTEDITTDSRTFTVYSETRNIEANEIVEYSLFDSNGGEIKNALITEGNIVAANNINATISIIKKLDSGNYTLKIKYKDYVYETNLNLTNSIIYEGIGTIDNPYLIYNEEDLKNVSTNLNAYYRLENDITLTEDWIPLGTEDTPFTGGFDGNGYSIEDLNASSETYSYSGIFGYVAGQSNKELYIKNLTIKDANVLAKDYAGILIGNMKLVSNSSVTIDSIYIIGGNVSGNYSGSLIGKITEGRSGVDSQTTINNIFTSANVRNANYSGVIAANMATDENISFSNIQNIGITFINDDDRVYNRTSFISSAFDNSYNVSNFIMTSYINIEGRYNDNLISGSTVNGLNGYFLNKGYSTWQQADLSKNIYEVSSVLQLKDINQYASWKDFDKYWKTDSVNGILRIPILRGVDFDYTEVSDIIIDINDTVSLLDYITPYTDGSRIIYTVKDNEDKIDVKSICDNTTYETDINITGLKTGKTTLHIVSEYDGYEGDINIVVKGDHTIYYHSNNGNNEIDEQYILDDEEIVIKENAFIKPGYIFKNWNTKADGSGITYSVDQVIDNINEDLELYAQWELITYDVTFDANGGTFKNDKTTLAVEDWDDSKLDSLEKPTRDGYSFKGFFTEKEGGTSLESYIAEAGIDQDNLVFFAQWEEEKPYIIEDYVEDKTSNYIDKVDLLTDLETYKSKFKLGNNYRIELDLSGKEYVFTGSKTKIYKDDKLFIEFTNIVRGEVNGDGKVGYADYVYVYNHIYKTKHPDSNKTLLVNEYLLAADMSGDANVGYADYVMIYNKIKELKGGNN